MNENLGLNELLIKELQLHFIMLGRYYEAKDEHRAKAFYRAIETLDELSYINYPNAKSLNEIYGIGPSVFQEITEFIERKSSNRLDKILESNPSFKASMKRLVLDNYPELTEMVKIWKDM